MTLESLFDHPLDSIQNFFSSGQINTHADVKSLLLNSISNDAKLSAIPLISSRNVWSMKSGSLVRLRCMVQDMCEPEYSYAIHEVTDTRDVSKRRLFTHYVDHLSYENIVPVEDTICQRSLYVVVDVPGETFAPQESFSTLRNAAKRPLDDGDMDDSDRSRLDSNDPSKRGRTLEASSPVTLTDSGTTSHTSHRAGYLLKLYDAPDNDLKLNEVIEVIGILQFPHISPTPSNSNEPKEDNGVSIQNEFDHFFNQFNEKLEVQSLPVLHAIHYEKEPKKNTSTFNSLDSPILRQQFLDIVSKFLGGDRVVAEYLLLHIASHIQGVVDMTVLGKFDLNIVHCPSRQHPTFGARLSAFIRSITRRSLVIPLNLDRLNHARFRPCQKENESKLFQGALQLAKNTRLLIDETSMNEGQLNETGIDNIRSLLSVIETNRLNYQFQYFQKEFEAHYPALILSEGKSLFPSTTIVPLAMKSEIDDAAMFVSEQLVERFREWIAYLHSIEFTIPEEVAELIQKEFASERQKAGRAGKVMATVEQLHYELTSARLIALTHGDTSLTIDHWKMMKSLEMERNLRVTDLPVSNRTT